TVLMPLCLCAGGVCSADPPGETTCCHSAWGESVRGESENAPCPHCDGAEISPLPVLAKPVTVPTSVGEDLPALEAVTEASFPEGFHSLILTAVSEDLVLFPWWQTHCARLAVFLI